MTPSNLPVAKFQRFERVTVVDSGPRCERHRGGRGTVLWRDPYCVRKEPGRPDRWLYLVYLPAGNCYGTFFQSELESEREFDTEAAHLGRRPEISFDTVLGGDDPFVEGSYRLPGKFWEVVIFAKADVSELLHTPSKWGSGITGIVFHVPRAVKLNREYMLRALAQTVGYSGWVQVEGPDSMILR